MVWFDPTTQRYFLAARLNPGGPVLGIIDGLVNLTARVIYGIGNRLRGVQTGYIRSYVLFLVVAAIAIFGVMVFVVSRVIAK